MPLLCDQPSVQTRQLVTWCQMGSPLLGELYWPNTAGVSLGWGRGGCIMKGTCLSTWVTWHGDHCIEVTTKSRPKWWQVSTPPVQHLKTFFSYIQQHKGCPWTIPVFWGPAKGSPPRSPNKSKAADFCGAGCCCGAAAAVFWPGVGRCTVWLAWGGAATGLGCAVAVAGCKKKTPKMTAVWRGYSSAGWCGMAARACTPHDFWIKCHGKPCLLPEPPGPLHPLKKKKKRALFNPPSEHLNSPDYFVKPPAWVDCSQLSFSVVWLCLVPWEACSAVSPPHTCFQLVPRTTAFSHISATWSPCACFHPWILVPCGIASQTGQATLCDKTARRSGNSSPFSFLT